MVYKFYLEKSDLRFKKNPAGGLDQILTRHQRDAMQGPKNFWRENSARFRIPRVINPLQGVEKLALRLRSWIAERLIAAREDAINLLGVLGSQGLVVPLLPLWGMRANEADITGA